jgi:hypothetical protein
MPKPIQKEKFVNTVQLNQYQTEMILLSLSKTTGSTYDDEWSSYISNNDLVSLKNKLSKHLNTIKKNIKDNR